ncbi:MAG: hypothetical protein HC888_06740 [Candidatus Competibacteraceae bacterium]|nr:hypothetical protein [Candidatus Competibacteraceae bacterium]
MSDYILFKNQRAYLIKEDRVKNETTSEWEDKVEETELFSLRRCLNYQIKLEDGTLFDAVWHYIAQDADFYQDVFDEALGHYPLKEYVERAKLPVRDSERRELVDPNNSMHYLEVYWAGDYEDQKKYGGKQIAISPGFHGWGKSRHQNADGVEEVFDSGWSLSFTPINNYMGFETKLNKLLHFNDANTDAFDARTQCRKRQKDRQNVDKDAWRPLTLLEGDREFTVYDVLYAILYEITWHGLPEEQEEFKESLEAQIDGIKDGTIETFPFEELLEDTGYYDKDDDD